MTDLTPLELKKIAELIGKDWYKLGIKLKIPSHRLDNLCTPLEGGPERHPLKMLIKWYRANANLTNEVLVNKLIGALTESDLLNLAEKVESYVSIYSKDVNMEGVFAEISIGLMSKWRDVGTTLGVTRDDCDMISAAQPLQDDSKFRMLEIWIQSAQDNTSLKLIRALSKIERIDIVEFIIYGESTQRQLQQPQQAHLTLPKPQQPPQHSEHQETGNEQLQQSTQPSEAVCQAVSSGSQDTFPHHNTQHPTEESQHHREAALVLQQQPRARNEKTQASKVKQAPGCFKEWFLCIVPKRNVDARTSGALNSFPPVRTQHPTGQSQQEGIIEYQEKVRWFRKTQLRQVKQAPGVFAEWFHGSIPRRQAEQLLECKRKGTFLIRVGESHFGFTLSIMAQDRCLHYMVEQTRSKKYQIIGEPHILRSLNDLVFYYQQNTLSNRNITLGKACGQQEGECDYWDLLTTKDQKRIQNRQRESISHC